MSQIKRATCVEELLALLENVFNDQNTNFDEFKQRPDDIIISPFAKSGTNSYSNFFTELEAEVI